MENQIQMRFIDLLNEDNFNFKFKKKNKWIELIKRGDKEELKKNLYVLIDNAYGPIGGHVRIKRVDDVLDPKITFWEAVDVDDDPEADAVSFGKKTKFGIKLSGMGHDGQKGSKSALIKQKVKILNKKGYYIEASGKPADIYRNKGVKINDRETVEKVFGKVNWLGGGYYTRTHSSGLGKDVKKQLFGKPKT